MGSASSRKPYCDHIRSIQVNPRNIPEGDLGRVVIAASGLAKQDAIARQQQVAGEGCKILVPFR